MLYKQQKERTMNRNNTPYDDVFRTLLTDCKNLIIPVVNEIFNENYTGNEQVLLRENEIFLRQQNGKESKRITDSSFAIMDKMGLKNYHLECQSTPDGTMLIRMYEYDSQIALKDSTLENNILHVNFPQSAVLYLRAKKRTPDVLKICINTSGGSVMYEVPTVKVRQYDIDCIFEKRLLFLIPFYIFNYEEDFMEIEDDVAKLQHLREIYADIVKRLEDMCIKGELDEYTKGTICDMSEKVLNNIAQKYENIKKEVTKIMGGEVLEYPAKTILRQGIAQGMEEAARRMLNNGTSCEEVARILEMPIEDIRKLQLNNA